MRKRRKTVKLQRTASHRKSLLNTLAKQLVEHRRIRTTLAKAKALQPFAEKLLTYGKKALTANGKSEQETTADRVHYNRLAFAKLRDKDLVHKLVHEIAAASKDRSGGYTRITKLGQRRTDAAPMAFIEWVDSFVAPASSEPEEKEEPAKKPARGKKAPEKADKEDDGEDEASAKPKRTAKKKTAAAD
jgi:large subunit ribosomal protein L17